MFTVGNDYQNVYHVTAKTTEQHLTIN